MLSPVRTFLSILAVFILSACGGKDESQPQAQAVPVKVIKVARNDVPVSKEFVGQTKGAVDAEIRARVDGAITAIHFQEGKEVKEGQPLYSIDPAPYKAKLAEVQGRLSEAQTALTKAESDLKRIQPLAEMKAVSAQQLDAAVARRDSAKGGVDAAQASFDAAKIDLSYCEITSPTTGIIGMTKAKIGEYVGKPPNPVILNTVSKLDPIHVRFSITEQEYLYFARIRQKAEEKGQAALKRVLEMILADGSKYKEKGEVVSVDREVDPKTGTLMVEAAFGNPSQMMRPGQFAKVHTIAETISGALQAPVRAIQELQGQYQVFVLNPENNTVQAKTITVGPSIGKMRVVESGINENDAIVVEGFQRLKSGSTVAPQFISENDVG